MMKLMLRHTVQDFARWKVVFDQHESARKDAGLTVEHIWRNADNPNEVIVLLDVADVQAAQLFSGSAELKEAMAEGGVMGPPDAVFLTSD